MKKSWNENALAVKPTEALQSCNALAERWVVQEKCKDRGHWTRDETW